MNSGGASGGGVGGGGGEQNLHTCAPGRDLWNITTEIKAARI